MLKKQFIGAKIQIFEKRCSFCLQIFYESIPNLLGHPVDTTTRKKNDTGTFPPLLCSTILQDSSKIWREKFCFADPEKKASLIL